ncbi:uncharacterized protein L201_002664 [Kwoniella dendrophila CBS 6074]|uniref:Uncharacterized protein n=1 Tax=Kwoniella dendrophila CBS 6074 TaxID=1295534 RepID=A0AAX4JQS6_9TREE
MSKSVKLDQVNFAGGLPNEKDLIPAIIYLVAYVLSSPILYWRIINPQHRTKLLIYPTIFHTCRIIMLIIRIIMAKIDYGEGLFIAEFVFVSIGVFFLISTVISCWELQLESEIKKEDQPNWIKQLGRLLSLTIWASIATSVAGSSMISSALKHPDKLHVVTGLRRAGNLLSLGE